MQLQTEILLEAQAGIAPPHLELTWPGVREGLHKILMGYALILGIIVLTALAVLFLILEVVQGKVVDAVIDAALLLYFGMGIIFILSLWSLLLIIGGKVRCLVNAPERMGAKWMLFVSLVCFCVTPALDFLSYILPSKLSPEQVQTLVAKTPVFQTKGKPKDASALIKTFNQLRDFVISLMLLDGRAWLAVGGHAASLMSLVFFVLFLRAVALCFYDKLRQRLAELYLLFLGFLVFGSYYMFFKPPDEPEEALRYLLVIALGWFLALVWYVLLIFSATTGISRGLALREYILRKERGL